MSSRLAFLLLVALAACHTERSEEPAGMSLNRIERQVPRRAWNLVDQGQVLGSVVLFADPAAPADASRQFFSVRNPFQQELGTVDGLGRAWRFQPHRRDAALLGTGTVLEGARRILSGSSSAELAEVPLELLGAGQVPAGG